MDSFHVYIRSSNSADYFPRNTGNNFRVRLSEGIDLSNGWEIVLTSLSIVFNEAESADLLAGLVLDVHCNIAGFSIVGGNKRQMLRRVSLGKPTVKSANRVVFNVNFTENYCFCKPVITQHCSVIEIQLKHPHRYINYLLENCMADVSLHLRKKSSIIMLS